MKNSLVLILTFVGISASFSGSAMEIVCEAEYGGKTESITLNQTQDVFQYQAIDLRNRFRFQAQYLESQSKLKTYVYEFQSGNPVIIYAGESRITNTECTTNPKSLGLNKVYSSQLGREMYFQCLISCK
jgi:hypothetical protein